MITRICLVIFQDNAWKGWIEIVQLIYTHINRLVSFLLVKRFCHSQGNNSKLYYFIVTFQYLPQMSFFDNALQEAQLKEDYVSELQNNFPWIKVVQFVIIVRPMILQLAWVTNIPMLHKKFNLLPTWKVFLSCLDKLLLSLFSKSLPQDLFIGPIPALLNIFNPTPPWHKCMFPA